MTTGRPRRTTAALVLAATLGLVASACSGGSDSGAKSGGGSGSATPSSSAGTSGGASTGSSSAAADATVPPSPDLATFYSQKLDWQSCRSGDECAKLTVPLDYKDPTGSTIQLAVLKVPAEDSSQRLGSLVVDPGGPGGSAQDYAAAGSQAWGAPLLQHYDIVGMDPRGVGESDPITCTDAQGEDAYLSMDPDPDTTAEEQSFEQQTQAFVGGCVTQSGDLAAHVSTIEAAMDMDVLRAALGESTLTYFGASYGTKLGATYAEWFPTKVGRFVLDGAIDPALDFKQASASQAAGFQTALTAYVKDCVAQGDCPLGDSLDAGLARISTFLTQLDQKPLSTQSDRQLTEGLGYYGIIAALYNKEYWKYLTQAFSTAFDGDGSIMLVLADAYAERNQDGSYDGNLLQAFTAISCLDDPSSITPAQVPAEAAELAKTAPSFARIFAWGMTNCGYYSARSDQQVRPIQAKGAAPIVVIGTTRDPATPYQQAVDLAKELDSGVLVSRDGDGHTAYNSGNQCIDSAVEDYLVEGTVPKDGLSC